MVLTQFPDPTVFYCFNFSHGYLHLVAGSQLTEEEESLLARFTRVFEQTYARFLDLEKAEAQTRTAQINLAVERVRAKALAMHKSEEIIEVVAKLKDEVMGLDIPDVVAATIFLNEGDDKVRMWDLSSLEHDDNYSEVPFDVTFKLKKTDPHLYIKRVWENPENYFVEIQEEKDFKRLMLWLREQNKHEIAAEVEDFIEKVQLKRLYHTAKKLNNGKLVIDQLNPPTDEMETILTKMGAAFDLAYKRFEDLKNAEAQAKEALIEAAIERVRSRSMAMHKSSELRDVVNTLHIEFRSLNLNFHVAAIQLLLDETKDLDLWIATDDGLYSDIIHWPHVDLRILNEMNKARKSKTNIEILLSKSETKEFLDEYFKLDGTPQERKAALSSVEFIDIIAFYQANTGIFLMRYSEGTFTEEEKNITQRFSRVFEQTYTRFLDLKKAEAQAREAQIEAALERVRAKTMAMHKSSELSEVAVELFDQISLLTAIPSRFNIAIVNEQEKVFDIWVTDVKGRNLNKLFVFDIEKSEVVAEVFDAWKNKKKYVIQHLSGKRLDKWIKYASEEVGIPFDKSALKENRYINSILFKQGCIGITTDDIPNNSVLLLLERFAKVFEQTYTRFLDLQKAEEQARESQIEAALERVRSRSMAMHNSEELLEVINVVSEQLQQLGMKFSNASFGINTGSFDFDFWVAAPGIDHPFRIHLPYLDSPVFNRLKDAQINEQSFFADSFNAIETKEWMQHLFANNDIAEFTPQTREYLLSKIGFVRSSVLLKNIILSIINYEGIKYSNDENDVYIRFANAFEQAYTRFLDLQRAEAQTREAQIEGALEKVRSRSLAMHQSEELWDVIGEVFLQLEALKIQIDACFINIFQDNHPKDITCYIAAGGQTYKGSTFIPYDDFIIFNRLIEAREKEERFYAITMGKEEKDRWWKYFYAKASNIKVSINRKNHILKTTGLAQSVALGEHASIHMMKYVDSPYLEEENKILMRFVKAFDQVYTRFLDLQKAEAQTKEAQIEAALERVRSRTLAMQKSEELAETSVIVFKQLLELGIAPNRLFIGIIKNDNDTIEAWSTNVDGSKLANQFSPQASKNKSIKKMLDGWKQQKKSLVVDMKGKELETYFRYLSEDMKVPFIDGLKQKRRVQTIAYFSGGLIGMAAPEEQPDDTIHLLERFAAVFNLTYTRFKDLKIAEANAEKAEQDLIKLQAAKKSAEDALSELQLTQTQLIQSEKMASLGELTAGIAHEIQNPLNFVNNFSEVSKELLDEMLEELENGDMEEVRAIMDDVIQNLEKINHHGKRADGIVKGMLQHSRSSTGTKEAVNINTLADEYLRLAYHGLRAKDKSFNATLVTDFDDNIGTIKIIPQDIGRVVLNLLTNAFYIVNEKQQSNKNGYEPTVTLTTKKTGNLVIISVKDNGNGIPKHVLEKIFQPFFTTKPTGQGTGLGLSMSYDIVTKGHGGELNVETKEGEGTTFIIKLPNN